MIYFSATAIAKAIRNKEISSTEVVDAYLNRIKEVNPKLNAVVQLSEKTAHDQALKADKTLSRGDVLGLLHGVPFTIKDSFDTAGLISTGGTKGRSNFVPSRDATVVSRLRAAGGSAFDIGSDYGGSLRFPSHCCGIATIKPTSGRVPRTGHILPSTESFLLPRKQRKRFVRQQHSLMVKA